MARRPRTEVIKLWDGRHVLGRYEDGIPTWGFRQAPSGLATRRQLRARGLCPGGHDLYGQLKWRRGTRWAALYRLDLAKPKPARSPAQRAALARANTARRTCRTCPPGQQVKPYFLPTSTRQCWACWAADKDSNENGAAA